MKATPIITLVALCLLGTSCGLRPRPAKVPLPTMWEAGSHRTEADRLAILLPGRLGRLPQFRNWGFFDLIREECPGTDTVATDLHIGYYEDKTFIARLREDVIDPAKARGVEQFDLVGISLGGFGALAYAIENPGAIDRLVLLAPFVGDTPIIDEIEAAGGLVDWQPGEITDDDFQRRLWAGLKQQLVVERGRRFPQVYLGFASGDRFARANRLLARHLPAGTRVFTMTGGHDWPEWRLLFRTILRSEGFCENS